MDACAINPGDITFLRRAGLLPGSVRQHDVWGASGAGVVIAVGEGVPVHYLGKKAAVYRSLVGTDVTIGAWCSIAQMHYLACVPLPDSVESVDYAGSLVNVITPYAFLKHVQRERHQGILVTAGNSATGVAMLGIALAYQVPIVSIVRNEKSGNELSAMGAKNILVQSDADFDRELAAMAQCEHATAIFDGVGGDLINHILPIVPRGSAVYSYGYLGGQVPVTFPMALLMFNNLKIESFSNFASPTVQDKEQLKDALGEISRIIGMPQFKTKRGKSFGFAEISAAMAYQDQDGGKAILDPRISR